MKKPTLKQLKKVVCYSCALEYSCAKDIKCNTIESIEKLFGVGLK